MDCIAIKLTEREYELVRMAVNRSIFKEAEIAINLGVENTVGKEFQNLERKLANDLRKASEEHQLAK